MKHATLALLLILCGCTAGGVASSGGGSIAPVMQVTKINVSLAAFPLQNTSAGSALGFSPEVVTIAVGSGVQFVNVDNTSHTATSFAGSTFPSQSPLGISATSASGSSLSGGFSSGTLQAGSSSNIFLVDRAGTYLYGCFFHYSGNMRGMIVAQ
jgi:plastocyanin